MLLLLRYKSLPSITFNILCVNPLNLVRILMIICYLNLIYILLGNNLQNYLGEAPKEISNATITVPSLYSINWSDKVTLAGG
jgi:hypothetical protein